jgi:hypothetical protein
VNTADTEVCELVEGSGREVEIMQRTARAAVGNSDGNLLSLVWKER